jgi:hypothetical protein
MIEYSDQTGARNSYSAEPEIAKITYEATGPPVDIVLTDEKRVSQDISLIQRTKQAQCVTCPNSVDRRSILPYRLAKVSESVTRQAASTPRGLFGIATPKSG